MTKTDHAIDYLVIDPGYSVRLGELRWAHALDSIEFDSGETFALNVELRLLLEGAAHGKSLPPFAYVLTLFHRMKRGEGDPLYRAFQDVKSDPASTRNAGLLIAELCRGLPGLSVKPSILELSLMLETDFRNCTRFVSARAEKPPLTHDVFVKRIAERLERFDEEELRHWLKHGQGRPRHLRRLAESVDAIDQRLRQLISACRTSERLVGALTISPTMDSALTLPPRQRSREAPPQGGYQDVTTRGDPERLLPSQFALDPDEFIRRFAGNELLYFQREIPHSSRKPERILILDQGVRTWGGVRLALAAGTLTLLKSDPRSFSALQLHLTSTPQVLSLAECSTDELLRHLEAADFSPHPTLCLKQALDPNEDLPRDLILLTHPRNLEEPELLKAIATLSKTDRLFALCVGDTGEAELVEWQRTGFVNVRSFRVDLATAESAKPERDHPPTSVFSAKAWTGAVEPIPFPFGVGLVDEILLTSFDGMSQRLVMVSRHGIPHALDLATSRIEVLPRAFRLGKVFTRIDNILPTNDGVVLVGRMQLKSISITPGETILSTDPILSHGAHAPISKASESDRFIAAHYDFTKRTIKVHDLGAFCSNYGWYSYPDLHCIALHAIDSKEQYDGLALKLSTGEWFVRPKAATLKSDDGLFEAWNRMGQDQAVYTLSIVPAQPSRAVVGKGPYLQHLGKRIQIHRWDPGRVDFEPMMDGKPLLEGATIWAAKLSGTLLAIHVTRQAENMLYLFYLPNGRLVREIPWTNKPGTFNLSPSQARMVVHRGRWDVKVLNVTEPTEPPIDVSRGHLHNNLDLLLNTDPFSLRITIGKVSHLFSCDDGVFRHSLGGSLGFSVASYESTPCVDSVAYDPERFSRSNVSTSGVFQAVMDRLGQVLLFRSTGELVAIFLVRRSAAAVWLPSGIFWGDPALIGAAPHPDAAKRVGEAIMLALR